MSKNKLNEKDKDDLLHLIVIAGIIFVFIGIIVLVGLQTYVGTIKYPNVIIELNDNGIIDGKREFVFSYINTGEKEAELVFPTWLEYNYSLEYLSDNDIDSVDGMTEHIDLVENGEPRTLVLQPNEKIDYRIHLSGYPEGEYEITVSPAVDVVDVWYRKLNFTIE